MPNIARMAKAIRIVLPFLILSARSVMAADSMPLPDTISTQARAVIDYLQSAGLKQLKGLAPDDTAGWKALHDEQEKALDAPNKVVLDNLGARVTDAMIGGVPVLDIYPKGWRDDGRIIIYVHGGAFTLFSARSMAGLGALVANAAGMRTISIDYTNPPAVQWETVQDQIRRVVNAIEAQGTPMNSIALFGDSAGGNLVIRAVLNMREEGKAMPGAVLLFSPWVDLSNSGDTAITLAEADPTLSYGGLLANAARAYAGSLDLKDPRVSPIYADFTKGFPPTMIQDGTRTILLSDSVRTYRALKDARQDAIIDLYEGMWHVFQGAPAPEAQEALASAGDFLKSRVK